MTTDPAAEAMTATTTDVPHEATTTDVEATMTVTEVVTEEAEIETTTTDAVDTLRTLAEEETMTTEIENLPAVMTDMPPLRLLQWLLLLLMKIDTLPEATTDAHQEMTGLDTIKSKSTDLFHLFGMHRFRGMNARFQNYPYIVTLSVLVAVWTR